MTKRRTLTSETDYGSHSNVISLFLYLLLSSASETKASCKKLSSWIDLSLTLDGRDKITKTIQYTCRFLAWWYGNNKFRAIRLRNLQKSLTSSRKAYRFGRTITELHKLKKTGIIQNLVQHYCGDDDKDNHVVERGTRRNSTLSLLGRSFTGIFFETSINTKLEEEIIKKSTKEKKKFVFGWREICIVARTLGLAGFWLGDNVTYLTSIGFLDTISDDTKMAKKLRETRQRKAQFFAGRCYFIACVVGLYANFRELLLMHNEFKEHLEEYLLFERGSSMVRKDGSEGFDTIHEEEEDSSNSPIQNKDEYEKKWKMIKRRYFLRVIALVKSICDTLVFSNNPGIDLHLKLRGKKMHEGLHSILGVISASTVLYNKFPDCLPK